MFPQGRIKSLNDLFVPLSQRERQQTYFVRIHRFNADILQFLQKYYTGALQSGVLIESTLPNPDKRNLTDYQDTMGQDFEFDHAFIEQGMKKWIPHIEQAQRQVMADAIYAELEKQSRQGKTISILKNSYIKYCCWIHNQLEGAIHKLGLDEPPHILYIGQIGRAELQMLHILNRAGCDIVLVQKTDESVYLKIDAQSEISQAFDIPNGELFSDDFSMTKSGGRNLSERASQQREDVKKSSTSAIGQRISVQPLKTLCINTWDKVTGRPLEDALMPATLRCSDERFIGTVFAHIHGVEDKYTYQNELRQFYQQLLAKKRPVVIINGEIERPTVEEIQSIRRGTYQTIEDAIVDLRLNIMAGHNSLLQNLMYYTFTEIMLQIGNQPNMNVSRLVNTAVYLLCWLKRYQKQLFERWQTPQVACLIFMGSCQNERENYFLRMMARLPVDVIVLSPNLDETGLLRDDALMDINYEFSMSLERFPDGHGGVSTVAHEAQRELNSLLYQNTGMYRERQFSKAESIALHTTYDEITQLWNEDIKYRPNYAVVNNTVNIPVIYAKVCGIAHGDVDTYWSSMKRLMTEQTKVVTQLPFMTSKDNPWIAFPSTEFYQKGMLRRDKIQAHRQYPFGILREETQTYMLDKLQWMLDEKLIRGIGTNGMEYQVISTILNLPKEFQRMIQQFDFTQKNPKLLIVNTKETIASVEDAILITFLHLIGFDIVIFVPTGYQSIEKWLAEDTLDEHQLGKYMYNLSVPDFRYVSTRVQFRLKNLLNLKNLINN